MRLPEIREASFYYPVFGGEMVRDPILTTKSWGSIQLGYINDMMEGFYAKENARFV